MKQKVMLGVQLAVFIGGLVVLGTGCTTSNPATSSTQARPLRTKGGASVDLSQYQVATVLPFQSAKESIDGSVGVKFANGVAIRLGADYGPIFKEVRKDAAALGVTNELIVTGTIREYKPGDKFARAMLAGLGAASFKGDLLLKDGASGQVLLSAPFDKLWAWGGMMGVSKGIDDMVAESEATVAATVARAKGWQSAKEKAKAK